MFSDLSRTYLLAALLCGVPLLALAQDAEPPKLKLIAEDDFEQDRGNWEWLDPDAWQYATVDDRGVMSQYGRAATYKPPHRSPFHVALLRDHVVSDFDLTVSVKSTVEDYGHRDACLFFGYVDAAHFYYVHIGKATDPHCNQIFKVDGADRKAISLTTTDGTPWNDQWHRVKIARRVETGLIEVFFDDFDKPIMTAEDTSFTAGRVGLGSFDDTADWDDFELRAIAVKEASSVSDEAKAE